MIILADGGSTKTQWVVVDNKQTLAKTPTQVAPTIVRQIIAKGINPFFQTRDEIAAEIQEHLMQEIKGFSIDAVYFYGAGCSFPEKNEMVKSAIRQFIDAKIEVGSDLLAAARALCGKEPSIACIMGTGSNSCYYDGQTIQDNVSPLGFILGDEGSGAVLGKLLVGDCLKNQLSPELKEKFFAQFELTPAILLERVYKQAFPNRFLASLSPFLIQNINDPQVYALVFNAIKSFFVRNVMQYDYKKYKVHLVGSIAFYYKDIIQEVTKELGIDLGNIIKSPMEGLIKFHDENS
ncbi:ATPase [Bacteroidales bacterium]|nr:ATPase [Bacteroidales bacterium]